jgi:hypothetical protein
MTLPNWRTMIRSIVSSLVLGSGLAGTVDAQQDQALVNARKKFEEEIAKLDKSLVVKMEKASDAAKKNGDKALFQKLSYERQQFVTQHLVPTEANTYLQDRSRATVAIMKVYQTAINKLTKEKKFQEAAAVEDVLDESLKSSRGYGLAFPDLDMNRKLMFMIENKESGLVVDTEHGDGRARLVLTPKEKGGKSKPTQCWRLEREEKGFAISNVKSDSYWHAPFDPAGAGALPGSFVDVESWRDKTTLEIGASSVYRFSSTRKEIVIEATLSDLILTATSKAVKGATTTFVTQEKKNDKMPTEAQIWKLIEIK